MTAGWCPFADPVEIPGSNYALGNDGQLAVSLHIVVGSLASCISTFKNPKAIKSAHFVIGKDGSLVQFVSIDDTAYAQGIAYDRTAKRWFTDRPGEGKRYVKPTWKLLTTTMNVNRHIISIEHEGNPGDPLTNAMKRTQTRLLAWIAAERDLVYAVGSTLIGHFMLDDVGRAFCPGKAFDLAAIASAANAANQPSYTQLWGTHYDYFFESGIAAAWRERAAVLGAAVSDETKDARGHIWRLFEHGAVDFDPKADAAVVYEPRGA